MILYAKTYLITHKKQQVPIIVPEKEIYCETFVTCCTYGGSDDRAIYIVVSQKENILYRAKVNMPVCEFKNTNTINIELFFINIIFLKNTFYF